MTDAERDVRVDLRLGRAIRSGALPKQLLLSGPAGTGKTFGVLSVLHTILADHAGLRMLMCRQTRTSQTHSTLATYEREILPADGMEDLAAGCSRRVRESYRYPNGSELVTAGLDRPDRVLSSAWDIVYVNEALETQEDAVDALSTRLNRPGRRLGWLLMDCNPGDPTHWLKKRADEGRIALWETTHRANPAMWRDGGWTEKGLAYLATLETLRGTRRKRFLDGLWCVGEGQWFDGFGSAHVDLLAAYDPSLPVVLAIDSGVYTGAVAFQRRPQPVGPDLVTVFFDYLSEGLSAYEAATAILAGLGDRRGRKLRVVSDPAGGSRNPVGPTVLAEYRRAGLGEVEPWPLGGVSDGLALVEALLDPGLADGSTRLLVHPSCGTLVTALTNYRRAKRQGQWTDRPEDPQHPHEDLVDSLRGGLRAEYPAGLVPLKPRLQTVSANRFMY